jgi:hypoxanthine-DNA glycosylase
VKPTRPTPVAVPVELPCLLGLPPVLARHTRALVLGSFPGVASLAAGQYYAHPRNQFWPLLGVLWGMDLASWPYRRRLAEMRRRGLGLWDVYAACRRPGSLDQAIRDAELNDFAALRRRAPGLRWVLHNGAESARVRRELAALGYESLCLPSTSPANAGKRFEAKVEAWGRALSLAGLDGLPSSAGDAASPSTDASGNASSRSFAAPTDHLTAAPAGRWPTGIGDDGRGTSR